MSLTSCSIRDMLAGALLVAFDCAAVRVLIVGPGPVGLDFGLLAILPMSNVLAVGWYLDRSRRGVRRPFAAGFLATGAATALACFGFCLMVDHRLNPPVENLIARTFQRLPIIETAATQIGNHYRYAYYIVIRLIFYFSVPFVPQLLLALLGGWAARRVSASWHAAESAAPDPPNPPEDAPMIRTALTLALAAGLAAGSPAPAADGKTQVLRIGELSCTAPASWASVKPSNSMRQSQYKIDPADGDSQPAELAVFVFPGGAGSVQSNIDRWQKQFKDASGALPKVESAPAKGVNTQVTRVEIAGTFTDSFSKAGPQANFRLLGAIVESPDAGYFLKLTGPDKTILAAEKDFDALIASLTLKK